MEIQEIVVNKLSLKRSHRTLATLILFSRFINKCLGLDGVVDKVVVVRVPP